jgi:hypothetical protein
MRPHTVRNDRRLGLPRGWRGWRAGDLVVIVGGNELWLIAAQRNDDVDRIICAVGCIVELQSVADPAEHDAHDGVGLRVEVFRLVQHAGGDVVFLELVAIAGKLFVDDVLKQFAQARGTGKALVGADAGKRIAHLFGGHAFTQNRFCHGRSARWFEALQFMQFPLALTVSGLSRVNAMLAKARLTVCELACCMMSKSILIIHNPVAGQRTAQLVHAVSAALHRQGATVSLRATTYAGEAEEIARAERGCHDVIAVAGGDGTLMEVVNGLGPDDDQLVAIIPAGTANVVALELGLPRRPARWLAAS